MHRFVRRPSVPLVIACGALFFALAGTSFADVAQLARNSVGTPQLRNNAVTPPKIRNGAVTTPKIANGAVTTPKLRNGAVTLAKLAPNARIPGPPGPAGPAGPAGPPGPPVDLADGSITTVKLADNAVTTAKLANAAVTSATLASNAVTASKLATTLRTSAVSVTSGTTVNRTASCAAGEKAIGGGAVWSGSWTNSQAEGTHLVHSYPGSGLGSWSARGYNGSGSTRTLTVYAICSSAG